MRGVLTQRSGPRSPKTKDFCPSLRWLSVNSLGNVFLLGYHLAIDTLAWTTAAVRREGGVKPGLGNTSAVSPELRHLRNLLNAP